VLDTVAGYVYLPSTPQLGTSYSNGQLTVTNSVTGTSHPYAVGGGTVMPGQDDLNGYPGNEIVFTGPAGTQTRILVIDDSTTAVSTYLFENAAGGSSASLLGPYTLGTSPGKALVYLINGLGGTSVAVIRERTHSVTRPINYARGFVSFLGADDFAGNGVNELALSGGAEVLVVDTDTQGVASYPTANATNITYLPGDTDGVPGKEILVSVTGLIQTYFKIIHHRSRSDFNYFPGGLFISARDRDQIPGVEPCYYEPGSGAFRMIVDRNRTVQTVPNCN
jgi:hypothetical protein